MTSSKQGTASMRKTIKSAPEQQQRYLSTMLPLMRKGTASMRQTTKLAPEKQQRYLSTMIALEKGTAPNRKRAKSQQDYNTMDADGSQVAADLAKPNEDYVMPTRELKLAVKAPKLVKKEGYYWMCTGDPKSVKKEGYYWICTGDPKSVKKEGYYWICTGDPMSVKQEGGYWICMGEVKSQLQSKRKARGIRRKRKGSGQNLPDGRAKGFCADHRKLCISIGMLFGLIVLAGAAAVIYFFVFAPRISTSGTTTSSTIPSTISSTTSSTPSSPRFDEDGLLAYEAICISSKSPPTATLNVNWKECIMGPPPRHDSCSGTANCTFYAYQATWNISAQTLILEDKTVNVTMKYDKRVVPKRNKNTSQLLCRTTSDKLGLCNGTVCTGAWVEDESSWYEKSTWEDNCEELNPCWQGNAIVRLRIMRNRIARTDCLKMDAAMCGRFNDRAAVVWMQHLRCNSGKDRSRKAPCPGVPLKLWVCAKCNRSLTSMDVVNNKCEERGRIVLPCDVTCRLKGESGRVSFEIDDGAECINSTSGSDNKGYCFQGTCFHNFTLLNETNRHELDVTHCRNRKGN